MYGRDVLYAYAAANLLTFCRAGLDGTFFGAMYDRYKEDPPTTFTPGKSGLVRIGPQINFFAGRAG